MKYKNTQGGFIGVIIAVIVVVLIGGGAVYYNTSVKSDEAMMEKEAMMAKEKMEQEKMMAEKEAMMEAEGTVKVETGGEVMMKKDDGAVVGGTVKVETSAEVMVKAGTYEAYAPEKLAKAANGDVVLFFKASWCPTCRAVDKDIMANISKIPPGLSILTLDYDTSTELKKKYGVTYQHTFVQVDASGKLIKKWSGSPTLSALVAEVQ